MMPDWPSLQGTDNSRIPRWQFIGRVERQIARSVSETLTPLDYGFALAVNALTSAPSRMKALIEFRTNIVR